MKEAYRIGNAQSVGSYQIQSNYFSTKINGKYVLAVLADGRTDHINGRRCAILAAEVCMQEFQRIVQETEWREFCDSVTAKILREMRDIIYLGKMPYLSVSFLFAHSEELFYFTVGSNKVFIFDGRDYRPLAGQSGRAVFQKGMTAGMISQGIQEALYETELAACLRGKGHPYNKAQQMIRSVREKNWKNAGNATVVLVEDCL